MADGGYIQVEGLDRVLRNFAQAKPEVAKAAVDGMVAEGLRLIATAQRNLKRNTSWVTGLLAASGRVERVKTGDDRTEQSVEIGFFEKDKATGYAEYVEYGRRPGKMPPPTTLAEWFHKKHRVRDPKQALSMGWGLAKNIAARGTRPHPFFNPALQQHQPRFARAIRAAVAKVINKDKS